MIHKYVAAGTMRSGVRWKTSAFYGRAVPEIKWKKRNKQKKRNPANLKRKRRRKLVSRCRQNGERKNSNTITDHGRTSAKKNLPQTTVSLHFYTIASLQLLLIVIISVTCVYVIFLFKCYHRDKKIGGNSMKNVHELRNSVNGAKMLFWKGQNYND